MTDKSFFPTTKLFLGLLLTSERSKTLLNLSALNLLRSKCFMTLDELLAFVCSCRIDCSSDISTCDINQQIVATILRRKCATLLHGND